MNAPLLKAKQLFSKGLEIADNCGSPYPNTHAKEIAMAIVKENISTCQSIYDDCISDYGNTGEYGDYMNMLDFWTDVHDELLNIQQ